MTVVELGVGVAARLCIARSETLHRVNLAPEHMFVQTAGKTDVQGS
jgi:hypothetical protein